MKEKTLQAFCEKLNITITDLSRMSGVSFSHLYRNRNDRQANWTRVNYEKIYKATKLKYGAGLKPEEYSDLGY